MAIIKVPLFSIGDKMTKGYNRNFFFFFWSIFHIEEKIKHFYPLEAIGRGSETHLQMGENEKLDNLLNWVRVHQSA